MPHFFLSALFAHHPNQEVNLLKFSFLENQFYIG